MMSPFLHLIAHLHQRTLVDAGVLVGALVFHQAVDIDARLRRIGLFGGAHDDTGGVDLIDHAGAAGGDGGAEVTGDYDLYSSVARTNDTGGVAPGRSRRCGAPRWRRRSRGANHAFHAGADERRLGADSGTA